VAQGVGPEFKPQYCLKKENCPDANGFWQLFYLLGRPRLVGKRFQASPVEKEEVI
jgi:hypothetical protein